MPLLNTLLTTLHLFRDMMIIGKESAIAFSAIDKSEKAILRQYYQKVKRKVIK